MLGPFCLLEVILLSFFGEERKAYARVLSEIEKCARLSERTGNKASIQNVVVRSARA
jgi:hypothetical protein